MDVTLAEQTNNAFEFIRKLYFEISYLIKEIEGLLQEEDEKFIIGRPSGYGVTTKSSAGLESYNVEQWLNKSFTVFFCPESSTEIKGGQSITEFSYSLKLLIVHIKLIEKGIQEPQIYFGVIRDIQCKKDDYHKFEKLMWLFPNNGEKIFSSVSHVDYEDNYCSFNGDFKQENLFELGNSDDIKTKIIEPMLKLYRSSMN